MTRHILAIMTLLCVVLLMAPLVVVVASAFTAGNFVAFPPEGLSLRWIIKALQNRQFLTSLAVSLEVATIVTLVGGVLGVLGGLALVRGNFRGREAISVALLSPVFVPTAVTGLALLQLFGLLRLTGSLAGVLIAYLVITTPYMSRAVVASLQGVDVSLEEAAAVLGATKLQTLVRVTVPAMARGLMVGCIYTFVIAFDESVIINFIAGPYTTTFPARLFSYLNESYNPLVSAYSGMLVVITVVMMVLLDRWLGLDRMTKVML